MPTDEQLRAFYNRCVAIVAHKKPGPSYYRTFCLQVIKRVKKECHNAD